MLVAFIIAFLISSVACMKLYFDYRELRNEYEELNNNTIDKLLTRIDIIEEEKNNLKNNIQQV